MCLFALLLRLYLKRLLAVYLATTADECWLRTRGDLLGSDAQPGLKIARQSYEAARPRMKRE